MEIFAMTPMLQNFVMICTHTEIMYVFGIQKLCKMYTINLYKMYAIYIQNNVSHISTNFFIHYVYNTKRTMIAKFFIQNVCKSLSKCGIHFVYILYTFFIHKSWSTISSHNKNYV